MTRRRGNVAAWVLACLTASVAGPGFGQSALPLKGTVDSEDQAPDLTSDLAVTKLELSPLEPADSVLGRKPRLASDPIAPAGIGNNGLRLYPSLTAGTIYSSNINTSADNPRGGFGLQLKPSARLESDWTRHSLTAGVDGNLVGYSGNDDFDTAKLDVFQRLRLDVRRHTTADISSSYALDEAGGSEATEHSLSGSLALTQDFGPMSARLSVGANARTFEDVMLADGSAEDNGDRDYIETTLALRTTYTEFAQIKPYLEASYSPRSHVREIDRNGVNRDSSGYAATAGVELDAGPLWTGDLGLTYLHRNYDTPSLGAADAIGLTGSLTWSPNELTKIVMATGTSLDETTNVSTPASAKWTASLDMTYALRDNVDLLAGVSIEIEDNGASIDKTYDGSLGLAWKFNPVLAWTAAYDLTWLDSGNPNGGYAEHRVSTGLTLSR